MKNKLNPSGNVSVKINKNPEEEVFLRPSEIYGLEYGRIFQLYFKGKPSNDFFITTGCHDSPIFLWYCDDEKEHRLSSQNKKDLAEYVSECSVREIDARVIFELSIKGYK